MSKLNDDFEKEWDNNQATYKKDLEVGGNMALALLLKEINLHNYTIDNVKSVIQDKLAELPK